MPKNDTTAAMRSASRRAIASLLRVQPTVELAITRGAYGRAATRTIAQSTRSLLIVGSLGPPDCGIACRNRRVIDAAVRPSARCDEFAAPTKRATVAGCSQGPMLIRAGHVVRGRCPGLRTTDAAAQRVTSAVRTRQTRHPAHTRN